MPGQFIKDMEEHVNEINRMLGENDKLRIVKKRLKESASEWWRVV